MKRRIVVSKILVTVFASMFLLAGAPKVQAGEDEPNACSNATVQGGFGLHATGTGALGVPVARVGRVTFDGQGNLQFTATRSVNGVIASEAGVGTYTVNPDCTGIFIPTGSPRDCVIVDNGTELRCILTVSGRVFTEILKKQFPDRH